jgi:stearoyl-CoA desaturase (delta-9 desaturase)
LIEPEKVPLYKLGSVAETLYKFVASSDQAHKLKIEVSTNNDAQSSQWLAMIYSPFRAVASDLLLWESRDIVLTSVGILYLGLAYVASFYFPLSPLCVLCPFLGPKSKVARYVRDLQNDIRLAQGQSVEKKGGMKPPEVEELPLTFANVNWPMAGYLLFVHLMALYGLVVMVFFGGVCPLFGSGVAIKRKTYIMAAVLYFLSALGITAGAHRLWSHKAYKAAFPLRAFLMVLSSIANQGTIFHWARDHRVHHLYSDTVADPHDANRGFWFSHVGWLIFKKHPAVIEAGKKLSLDDLYKDGVVMFQKKADPFWNLIWCFGFPAFLALQWGESMWYGFLIGGMFRYCAILHGTWCVNSLVHAVGTKPYNSSHKTTENGFVSICAIGEGWHNWHHAFDWDYAAAELGASQQFNPTKIFIDAMAYCGLAWGRKRALEVWNIRKTRWTEKTGRPIIECLEGPPLFKRRVVTFGPEYEDDDLSPRSPKGNEAPKTAKFAPFGPAYDEDAQQSSDATEGKKEL